MRVHDGVAILFLLAGPAFAALSKADSTLVAETAKRAAYVEALSDFCSTQVPASRPLNETAIRDWQARNYWQSLLGSLSLQPQFKPGYEQLKAGYRSNLNSKPQNRQLCNHLAGLLHYPDFDPSVKSGAELARIAKQLGSSQSQSSPPATGPSDSSSRGSGNQVAAAAPAGSQMSAGEARFVAPVGWSVGNTANDSVTLARNGKYGGRSLIFVRAFPLSTDFDQSFRSAVRTTVPGLQLQYVKSGTTNAGLPAEYVQDSGRMNGGKILAQIAAVGMSVNGKLQLAELISSGGAGEFYPRKKDLEDMVRSWQLRNASGRSVLNAMQPPAGSGGIEGLFLGSSLQNQLNPLGGMDLKAIRTYLVLLKNGQAYRGLPKNGHVFDMDFGALVQKEPEKCGTYKVQGNSIQFTWNTEYRLVTT